MKATIILTLILTAHLICSSGFGQKTIDVTYVANSGFLIESSGKQVIIDALFKQGWDNYLTPSDSVVSDIVNQRRPFNKSNLMLITHNHGDHFDPAMVVEYLLNNDENILIGSPSVTNALLQHAEYKKFGDQIVQLDKLNRKKNDTTICGIRVQSFFIQHDARPQIENVGYLIEMDNLKIFHTGDYNGTEIVEFEKLQLQNENIDLALLNFYGFWTKKEEQDFTKKFINPKQIALMHIPPAEVQTVKDTVERMDDFIDITVFEHSMESKSFVFE